MNIEEINGTVSIKNGKLEINISTGSGEIKEESAKLLMLQNIVNETMFNFEKEYQKRFIPTKETIYILPIE